MKDEVKFKEYMTILGDLYNAEISELMLKTYWEIFHHVSDEDFANAVEAHIRNGKFFPKPVELLEMIGGNKSQVAAEAWETVLREIRDSENAIFPPDIKRAVEILGGAQYLGSMTERDLEFKRNQFMEIYQSVAITESNKLEHDGTPRIEH